MKNLNEFINEGAWGYEPDQNDGTLDLRGDIFFCICELVYDKCNKNHYDSKRFETDYAWEALGNIEYFIEEATKMGDFPLGDKNDSDKYYYWFRLLDKGKKNIFELYDRLLAKCVNDEEWIENWKEPDKMRKSLDKRKKVSERYAKLMQDHIKKEEKVKLQQNTAKQAEESQIKFA